MPKPMFRDRADLDEAIQALRDAQRSAQPGQPVPQTIREMRAAQAPGGLDAYRAAGARGDAQLKAEAEEHSKAQERAQQPQRPPGWLPDPFAAPPPKPPAPPVPLGLGRVGDRMANKAGTNTQRPGGSVMTPPPPPPTLGGSTGPRAGATRSAGPGVAGVGGTRGRSAGARSAGRGVGAGEAGVGGAPSFSRVGPGGSGTVPTQRYGRQGSMRYPDPDADEPVPLSADALSVAIDMLKDETVGEETKAKIVDTLSRMRQPRYPVEKPAPPGPPPPPRRGAWATGLPGYDDQAVPPQPSGVQAEPASAQSSAWTQPPAVSGMGNAHTPMTSRMTPPPVVPRVNPNAKPGEPGEAGYRVDEEFYVPRTVNGRTVYVKDESKRKAYYEDGR